MSVPELSGKGMFVFSDPGGAKPILSLIKLNPGINEYLVISDRVYDFFEDFNIPVTTCPAGNEEELIEKYQPDYIFTGTSYTSAIELRFVKVANKHKIPSYVFVDHYTNFLGRFELDGEVVYPGTICVLDNVAYSIAMSHQSGTSVIITGNYYQQYLKQWKVPVTKSDFLAEFNIPVENKIIVFAPDPLTNIGGKNVFGLDEITVWKEVEEAIKKLGPLHYTLIIKPHPNQDMQNFGREIERSGNKNIVFANTMHTNTLLFYADCVIGVFSSILIESQLLGTRVIRCLIGFTKPDPFAGQNVGEVVSSKEQLIGAITKIF